MYFKKKVQFKWHVTSLINFSPSTTIQDFGEEKNSWKTNFSNCIYKKNLPTIGKIESFFKFIKAEKITWKKIHPKNNLNFPTLITYVSNIQPSWFRVSRSQVQITYQVVRFSLFVKQCAAVTAKFGVSNVPAHMNKASPFFSNTNRLTWKSKQSFENVNKLLTVGNYFTIHGNVPLGAGAAPLESSSSHTIRPLRGWGPCRLDFRFFVWGR